MREIAPSRWAVVAALTLCSSGGIALPAPPDDDAGVRVIDLAAGPDSSFPEVVGVSGAAVYFMPMIPHLAEPGLYRTDGRTATRVGGVAGGRQFSTLGDTAWFAGTFENPDGHGGVPVVARIASGAATADVVAGPAQGFAAGTSEPTVVGGRIVFFADDGVRGRELWSIDPDTLAVAPLAETAVHPAAFTLGPLMAAGERAFVWIYDPPAAWTPCPPQVINCYPDPAELDGGTLTLWATDGTAAGTRPVRAYPGYAFGSNPFDVVQLGAAAGLGWYRDTSPDRIGRLWRTDGTPAGTFAVTDEDVHAYGPMREFGGRAALFVTRLELPFTSYLLLSDGTWNGTGIAGGPDAPGVLKSMWGLTDGTAGGYHFVAAHTLFATDGSHEPRPVRTTTAPVQPLNPAAVDDVLLFAAGDYGKPSSLWMSDGTAEGTHRVHDSLTFPEIRAGCAPAGDRVVFVATDADHGAEIRSFPRAWLGAAGPPLFDTDLDGFPDEVENALGSSFDDAKSRPQGMSPATDSGRFDLRRAEVRVRFDRVRGTVRLRAAIPFEAGRPIQGERLIVGFGGVVRAFTLDGTGRARASEGSPGLGSLRLHARLNGGLAAGDAAARLDVTLSGDDVVSALADEGVVARTGPRQRVAVPVVLIRASQRSTATARVSWRAGRRSGFGR